MKYLSEGKDLKQNNKDCDDKAYFKIMLKQADHLIDKGIWMSHMEGLNKEYGNVRNVWIKGLIN